MDQGFHFVARGLALVGFAVISLSLQGFFQQFRFERPVQNAAGAGLECLASPGPSSAGNRQQRGLLGGRQQSRHTDDLFGAGQIKIHNERGAAAGHDQFQRLLPGVAVHQFDA